VTRAHRRRLEAVAALIHRMIVCEGSHDSHEADCQRIASGLFQAACTRPAPGVAFA
jgi:hypothetical protein